MRYLYIHGANATGQSFNYISNQLSGAASFLEYSSADGFKNNLNRMIDEIADLRELFLVAHSLGGIYGLHLANALPDNFLGAVTIATPYGGSGAAEIARWMMPQTQLFRDITPRSWAITEAMRLPIPQPWCQIVTTKGNAIWLPTGNDGVVTQQSMRARPDMDLIEIELNHYEVLMSQQVIEIIRQRSVGPDRTS